MFIEPIDEAYFGKTPDVQKLQDTVDTIRKKYMDKYHDDPKTILKDKLFDQFIDDMKKTFGFKELYFGFDTANVFNCYTIPIRESTYGDLSDKYEVTKNGIKYKKDVQVETLIVCTKRLFFSKDLTSGEVMATIMHEVGHNFTDAVVPITLPLDTLKQSLKTFIVNFLSCTKRAIENLVPATISSLKAISTMLSTDNDLVEYINKNNQSTRQYLAGIITNTNKRRYIDEKFADQFATMYGYGPELSSVLKKIEYSRNNRKDSSLSNLIDAIYGLVDLSTDVMFRYDYPMLAARLKSSVVILERELEKDETMPPELKKELEEQISDINMLAMQYSNIDNNSNYSIAKKKYFEFMYKNLENGDLFSKLVAKSYNLDKVDQALELNKK